MYSHAISSFTSLASHIYPRCFFMESIGAREHILVRHTLDQTTDEEFQCKCFRFHSL